MLLQIFLLVLLLVALGGCAHLYARNAALQTRLSDERALFEREREMHTAQQTAHETLLRQEMREQFQREMAERTQQLKQTNQEQMDAIVLPLRQELERLRALLDTQRQEQTRHTGALEASIRAVIQHDQQRDRTTQQLAEALKNRGKVQGDWGEMVLENILRDSGLREGQEYDVQHSTTKEDGTRDRPDIIVRAADGTQVIIDSKVSLTAWTDYVGAEDDAQRQQAIKANHHSLWQHVTELSAKNYAANIKGAAPVVLMFVPNEGSYILGMNHDAQLGVKAYNKGVLIVNPTNLMVVLRLMFLSWQGTRQEENSRKIVQAAAKIYDKYATFCESYLRMGDQLNTIRTTYDRALGQLREGNGNLSRQLNNLLAMGITPQKQIPEGAKE